MLAICDLFPYLHILDLVTIDRVNYTSKEVATSSRNAYITVSE
jgi:hypothetical protein